MSEETKPNLLCIVQAEGAPIPTGFKFGSEIDELEAWAKADPVVQPKALNEEERDKTEPNVLSLDSL